MKNVVCLLATMCALMAFTMVANASKDGEGPKPGNGQAVVPAPPAQARIPGLQDKRVITPKMDYLTRYETMRNIKKRAAAKRNSLMLQAAPARQNQKQKGSPGQLN